MPESHRKVIEVKFEHLPEHHHKVLKILPYARMSLSSFRHMPESHCKVTEVKFEHLPEHHRKVIKVLPECHCKVIQILTSA